MADISLTINDKPVTGRDGMTILEVTRANGIDIPTLCYLEDLPPRGACRLCVVEVDGSRALVGSCHTPIAAGMVVHTHSPKVLEARRVIVELLLASHPDNCLVCDKANRCQLRYIAADLGIGLPRFRIKKHYYPVENENPYITRDMAKCIMCQRCVTACRTLKGERMFSVAYRGFHSKVIHGLDQPVGSELSCRDCDTCISLCPTGALSKPTPVGEKKPGRVLVVKE
jgi:NADH dehydrogenase/NADH:ubiquinone oxidoreductase subunit G